MLGGLSVKVEDVIEPELKKFLEEVFKKIGSTPSDKISSENALNDGFFNIFGNKAACRVIAADHIDYKDRSIQYSVEIYHSNRIDFIERAKQNRKELFFVISFHEGNKKYSIVVNSIDSMYFANYEVIVYVSRSKIAHYILSILTKQEEYDFIDNLMSNAISIVNHHIKFKTGISDGKKEFLSIISDVVNTGNVK